MLVLTRHVGEQVIIAGSIRLSIVAVKGDRVRIGIAAPESIAVDRKEVHDRRSDWSAKAASEEFISPDRNGT
jgi:carbon storage regulator